MLGEQGGNSSWVREKEDEEKIEGAKNIFCLPQKQKQKKNQIDLGWSKLTWVGTNWPRLKQIDLRNKLTYNIYK